MLAVVIESSHQASTIPDWQLHDEADSTAAHPPESWMTCFIYRLFMADQLCGAPNCSPTNITQFDQLALREIMSDSETNPDKLYDVAAKLKDQGDLPAAVEQLQKIVASHPDHVQSHMALGVYLQKLGQPDEAIKHAVKVTELNPADAFSFTQLSVIYQRCGKILEAEDAMAKARAIQGNPGH